MIAGRAARVWMLLGALAAPLFAPLMMTLAPASASAATASAFPKHSSFRSSGSSLAPAASR